MAKSTDIKVKLSSVDEVKQFVDVMRGYHGDVDISATNKNYMVDAKSILGVISLDLRDELTVKFYDGFPATSITLFLTMKKGYPVIMTGYPFLRLLL